jgi:hypothetical protein
VKPAIRWSLSNEVLSGGGIGPANLLKNFFTDDRPAANVGLHVFYHVANHVEDAVTDPLVYYTFPDKVSSIIHDPAKVMVTGFGPATTNSLAHDCRYEGYLNGLQFRHANNTSLATTSAATALSEKERYWLAQNVPNPCAGSTSISYRIPAGEQSSDAGYPGFYFRQGVIPTSSA